jgi:cytochrome P450
MEHFTTYLIGAFLSFLATYTFICRNKSRLKPGYGHAPSIRLWEPIFGLDYGIKTSYNAHNWFLYHAKYGKTFSCTSIVGGTRYTTADADNVNEVLAGKDWGNSWRLDGMKRLVGVGLITTDGEEWSNARKMFKPAFKRANIADLEFVGSAVDRLLEKVKEGETVDMQPLLYETARITHTER